MFSDTDVLRWFLVASSTGIALAVYCLIFGVLKQNKNNNAPPVAPAGILETIRLFSGAEAPTFVRDMAKKTESLIYRIKLPLPQGVYIIGDSAAQREIFLDPTTDKPGKMFEAFANIGGSPNIFTRVSADPLWKAARKGSAPAFSSREVNRMNRICTEQVEWWLENRLKPMAQKGESFDPSEEMLRLTFRSIMESAFEYVPTDEEYEHFVYHLEIALREYTLKQVVNPLRKIFGFMIPDVRRAMKSCLEVRHFARKLLDAYRANPDKSPQNTLIKLIDDNKHFDEKVKISEVATYMVAGFDTTGYSLSSTLVLLAKHPEVCKKACESLNGSSQLSDYLQYCIAESTRMAPVGAMGSLREVGRDFTFHFGPNREAYVPKGAVVFMPQIVPNYDPSVYPDPEAFRPERWAEPSKAMQEGRLTFALGNRNCIGQSLAMAELNSVLPRLMSEYSFELVEEGKLDYFLTLKYTGARLKAIPLKKN